MGPEAVTAYSAVAADDSLYTVGSAGLPHTITDGSTIVVDASRHLPVQPLLQHRVW